MLQPTPGPKRGNKSKSTAPRPHERRAAGAYPYYRLATWQERSFTFKDAATPYDTPEAAERAATKPGKYRISAIHEDGSITIHEDFTI